MTVTASPEIENYWRYELKYWLTFQQYQQIKSSLCPYIELDPYTLAVPARKYLVRSLYFDSLDYQSYNEKLDGNHSRFKLRIRSYSKNIGADTAIRVEIKIRLGSKTEKHGNLISAAEYSDFMQHYHWNNPTNPVLIEFERNVHACILRPKVLVEYYREGFRTRDKEDIRVTFDHHVCSAQTKTLFPQHAFFRPHNPHQIILEIKHRDQQPDWLKAVVQEHGLKIQSNSKYCQGIEVTQSEFVNHTLRV